MSYKSFWNNSVSLRLPLASHILYNVLCAESLVGWGQKKTESYFPFLRCECQLFIQQYMKNPFHAAYKSSFKKNLIFQKLYFSLFGGQYFSEVKVIFVASKVQDYFIKFLKMAFAAAFM